MVSRKVKLVALVINELEAELERNATYEEVLDAVYKRSGEKESCSSSTISKARKYIEDISRYPDLKNDEVMTEIGRAAVTAYLDQMEFGQKSAITITGEAVKAELYRALLVEMVAEIEVIQNSNDHEVKDKKLRELSEKVMASIS